MDKDISIVLSGAAGQGIQTVEQLLVGIFKMAGFHVFATKEYESRVRGGTNSTTLRIGEIRVSTLVNRIDILVPFSKKAVNHVQKRLSPQTLIIADENIFSQSGEQISSNFVSFPFLKTANDVGNELFSNVVAVGAVAGIFGIDLKIGENFLHQRFNAKGETILNQNIEAYQKGYRLGSDLKTSKNISFGIRPNPEVADEILFNGNQAVALGAIAGNCNFISAYPMSPSTGVLVFLAQHSEEFEIVIDQAEDEIAAINKAIGAWYAGARALVSTSGGGFALMSEGLSLAGMIESPLVIHIAQRPGPATGLPTRTAQEDLNLALYSGHGEFARMIFAPGTLEQSFYLTQKAFNLADRYQVPVFILTDQDFVDGYYNIPNLDVSQIENHPYFVKTGADYKRYQLTEDGISPRGIPGYGEGLVRVDSDEHDEYGHITEDMEFIRPKMVEKRYHKRLELLRKEIEPPIVSPSEDYSTLILCWGSNYHVVKEAIAVAGKSGVSMLHFSQIYPMNSGVKDILSKAKKLLVVENNASGQFTKILRLETSIEIPKSQQFLRYTGKPWAVEEMAEIIKKEAI
ncbi:MAG: 2-oxoacid:acceptor oxidoreductase subunit alpha [Promethearchaeia archaeon]|nr:MAG: 2-oxoacid:acceptor oxidoreductase subunit alpha [Candidatus Lokiarchaeia archaeon]